MELSDFETLEAKRFLTPDEAAIYLNIGRSSVYARLRDGDIPSIRIGRLIRIPRTALDGLAVDSRDLSSLGPPDDSAAGSADASDEENHS